ncbi:MAG: hypothetical protein HRU09_14250 [Oligoflexales bacterium]|nr:hypothetical protein [Oligoflexales bacterium]
MNFFQILLLCSLVGGCAINRAPSLNMLEKTADYQNVHEIERELNSVDHPLLVPVRTSPQIADIWVHPQELPNGDYFRGGWIRTVITRSHWQIQEQKIEPLVIPANEKGKGKLKNENN